MQKIKLLSVVGALGVVCGCQGPGVPETRINLGLSNGTTGNFVFPKNVEITKFKLQRTEKDVTLSFESYKAKNDAGVISASAEGTAQIIEATSAGAASVAAQVIKAQSGGGVIP